MEFEVQALSSGKVKPLRLVSLGDAGELIVQSVEHEFSDKYFTNIGICSYTWGHNRVDWYDKETDLTWKISDRAEKMCRAALEFFDKVWIDGLCMVQAWPKHIELNMGFMGKLYFHGTVVTEMCIGLKPEYCYRGWVQQEISFAKVLCVIKPLLDFINSTAGKEERLFIEKNKAIVKRWKAGSCEPFRERADNQKVLIRLLEDVTVYLLGLQRVIQGRNQEDLDEYIEEIYGDIDGFDFYLCNDEDSAEDKLDAIQHVYQVFNSLLEKIPSVVRLPREMDHEQVLTGAISSFRTGFFRFNSDRVVASFSLAEYVLKKESGELLDILDSFEPDPDSPKVDVVIANPGRWCTGFQPTAVLRTVNLTELTNKFVLLMAPKVAFKNFDEISQNSNLDKLFSIIHSVDVTKFEKYEYVLGFNRGQDTPLGPEYNLFLGIKNTESPESPVLGLLNVNLTKVMSFFISNKIIGKSGEWMVRAIALLNSSYHVHCLGAAEHTITTSYTEIMDNKDLPKGSYFTPILGALQYIEFALGILSNYVSFHPLDGEKLTSAMLAKTIYKGREQEVTDAVNSVKEREVVWGADSWEHVDI